MTIRDDLEQAADLLRNFSRHLRECGDNVEAQHDLVKLIVERVYVEEKSVVAMTLKSNYHLVMGHNVNEPTAFTVDPFIAPSLEKRCTCGDDGSRPLTCTLSILLFPRHITIDPVLR